jgi:3D (Asp-Asp-Asp) domain-containing protein
MHHKSITIITALSILLTLAQIPTAKPNRTPPIVYTVTVYDFPRIHTGLQVGLIDIGEFTVTAYAATIQDCGKTDGITRSGIKAVEGVTVASDWRVLPCGTRIYIDGIEGYRVVQDTGSAVRNNRIDIYCDSEQEAKSFGKQEIRVYILK